jgi:ribosomal protein L7/L12
MVKYLRLSVEAQEGRMNEAAILSAVIGLAVAIVFARLASLERRLNRLSRMDAKIDALLKSTGIHFDPLQDVPADVREALEQGKTILAIKRHRQATGVGLKEAKEFVDEIRRRQIVAS